MGATWVEMQEVGRGARERLPKGCLYVVFEVGRAARAEASSIRVAARPHVPLESASVVRIVIELGEHRRPPRATAVVWEGQEAGHGRHEERMLLVVVRSVQGALCRSVPWRAM